MHYTVHSGLRKYGKNYFYTVFLELKQYCGVKWIVFNPRRKSQAQYGRRLISMLSVREAAKKGPPLMTRPLRGGGGLRAWPLRKKELF